MRLDKKDLRDLIETARDHYADAQYALALPILEQLSLQAEGSAEVFHMLATIYFDKGKFKKAIKTYRRALEIDPTYTDSAVGLSVVLTDLGKYQEAQEVFERATTALKDKLRSHSDFGSEKLALKHDELAELYLQSRRFEDALEQYRVSAQLAPGKLEYRIKAIDCLLKLKRDDEALRELRSLISENPSFVPARLKLGLMLYQKHRTVEAIDQWEAVLRREPDHPIALQYLQMAQKTQSTELN